MQPFQTVADNPAHPVVNAKQAGSLAERGGVGRGFRVPALAMAMACFGANSTRLMAVVLLGLAAGCGGGGGGGGSSSSSSSTSSSSSPPPSSQPGPDANIVTISAGQQTTKANIEVGAMTPTLSLVAVGVGNSAGSVGVSLKQGSTTRLLLAGHGLVTGTQYSVSQANPPDITLTQPSAADFCTTTDGTPCVSLTVAVASGAALGPRNIMVTKSSGELAAFVGGIIVVAGP